MAIGEFENLSDSAGDEMLGEGAVGIHADVGVCDYLSKHFSLSLSGSGLWLRRNWSPVFARVCAKLLYNDAWGVCQYSSHRS
jgi:hypothetical protein